MSALCERCGKRPPWLDMKCRECWDVKLGKAPPAQLALDVGETRKNLTIEAIRGPA